MSANMKDLRAAKQAERKEKKSAAAAEQEKKNRRYRRNVLIVAVIFVVLIVGALLIAAGDALLGYFWEPWKIWRIVLSAVVGFVVLLLLYHRIADKLPLPKRRKKTVELVVE